jgi:predicted component of type VI protein secretion system
VLEVLDPLARTHLNARPIREKALLRFGDVLCLGTVTIHVTMDRDEQIVTNVPSEAQGTAAASTPARVVLRGVSGSHFGKVIAVNARLTVGSGADCGLVIRETNVAPRQAVIETVGDAIYLRNAGAANGNAVNGVRVRNAVVHPGDQLSFERSHFLVEAPGLPLRGEGQGEDDAINYDAVASAQTDPTGPASSGNGIWWLIGVSAVIGLLLVLLIHRGL